MRTFLAAALVVVLAVASMCVFALKPGGEFPKYDVGSNEKMREKGIRCFKDEDAALHSKGKCDGDCADCALKKEKI